jgi:hypothetical protein
MKRDRHVQARWGRNARLPSALLAVALVGMVASACSSGSGTPSVADLSGHGTTQPSAQPLTPAQRDQQLVTWTRCMRGHGIAEPDPYHRQGFTGLSVQLPPPGPATSRADAACGHVLQKLEATKQAGARQEVTAWLPALTRYAQCMRSHDIAMLDPDSQGSLNLGNVPGMTSDFGRYSPQFRTADSACRHLLPAAVHDDGSGP